MTEVQQLKDSIEYNQKLVDRYEKLVKLQDNPLFKELIMDGFCKDCIAEYLSVSVNGRLPQGARENAEGVAKAGAYLNNWFQIVEQQGLQAQSDIEQAKETIEQIHMEGK